MLSDSNVKLKDGRLLVKTGALAELEGVSLHTIRRWALNGMPHMPRAWFDYAECRKWISENKTGGGVPEEEGVNWKASMLVAEARLKMAKAEKEELELARIKGETVTTREMRKSLVDFMQGFKAYFLNLPDELMHSFEQYIPKRDAFKVFDKVKTKIDSFINDYIEKIESGKR